MQERGHQQNNQTLSDKDIQIIRKAYCTLTELFYQNSKNESVVMDLIILGTLIPQVIANQREVAVLGLLPIIEPLKIKSKSQPKLLQHIGQVISHLKKPSLRTIKYEDLLPSLQESDLFTVGCTIAIRFYEKIVTSQSSEFNWKDIISQLSRNITVNPTICIELAYLICRQNENYGRWAVKSGLVKYVFLSYIASTLDNRYTLYKAIKLLKVVSSAEATLLRDKQKGLALVIYTYDDYVPVVEGIIAECYDHDYCQAIDNRRTFDVNSLDQPYLWSYLEMFCLANLNEATIKQLILWLKKPISEVEEKKVYGILSNFSKFRKTILNEVMQILPKSESALLNYIKLCVNCCELDRSSHNHIKLDEIQKLVDKSSNPKVEHLFKYLKQLRNRDSKIGFLSQNIKKMFDMEKHADFMMERATKIPEKTQDLVDIQQILKEKDRSNEFQSDTLHTIKKRALNSLHTAVMLKRKLNLNGIFKHVELSDVKLLAKLLQILELCLTINEDLIAEVDVLRILEIIKWIEDNYQGEVIEWGSISQLINILNDEGEWKLHFHEIPEKCFWLLNMQSFNKEDEALVWEVFSKFGGEAEKYQHKIPFLIGFLSRALDNNEKLRVFNLFPKFFEAMFFQIQNSTGADYKINLLMLSTFIKNWHKSQNQANYKNNNIFISIIDPLIEVILHNFRGLEQEYQFLQNCLPYQIRYEAYSDNLDYLISFYGKLASYVFKQSQIKGEKLVVNYERIKYIGRIAPQNNRNIVEILNFLEEHSSLLQTNLLHQLLVNLMSKRYVYWLTYPNFFNIISKMVKIIANTSNPVILTDLTEMFFKLIAFILKNEDISDDQKMDLLVEIRNCLTELLAKKSSLDKEIVKKEAVKIPFEDVRADILQILSKFVISEEKAEQPEEMGKTKEYTTNLLPSANSLVTDFFEEIGLNETEEDDIFEILNIDQEPDNGGEMTVLEALRILKKIIEDSQSQNKFPLLYQTFKSKQIPSEYIDILGHLLAKFYPNRPQDMQINSIDLLLDKSKTRLSEEGCFELLSQHGETFCLARRWKLRGRRWIDLAMKRLAEGFYGDASLVAESNLIKKSELEYFYSQKYHELIISAYPKIQKEYDHTHVVMLIGTSARQIQIKQKYYRQKLHVKILQLVGKYSKNQKFYANLLYSLASLVYMQQQVGADLIIYKNELQMILAQLKASADSKAIVESGACLMANLSYSNEQVKEALRQLNIIPIFLHLLEAVQETKDLNVFKQILRVFGNLSLSAKCTQQLIDDRFCSIAGSMLESIDILTNLDDQKATILKTLLDLVANLASHKYKLQLFHKEGITDLLIALLQTTENNQMILTSCIDTLDCLCQNPTIQNYVVTTKKISYILVDILKMQTDEKLVVKSTRLLTNLTINNASIPHILKANLLNIMANIVMPHFYGNNMAIEQNKKMQTYILKIISRIYHTKPDKHTIVQSGYLDCLIRTVESSEVIEDAYVDLLYVYAEMMPNYLNKRAFICLIRILCRKVASKDVTVKCIRAVKKLSAFYQRNQPDVLIQGVVELYEKLLASEIKDQGLEVLAYHLMRSGKLREQLRLNGKTIVEAVRKIGETKSDKLDISKQIGYLINNPFLLFPESEATQCEKQYQEMRKGFRCKLYRTDGSSKKAVIDLNEECELRAYKYPDGEVKAKYVIDVRNIKDFQFNYPQSNELWQSTLFGQAKGMFDSGEVRPRCCCTLVSSKKWGVISFVNVEFESELDKGRFEECLKAVYNSLR